MRACIIYTWKIFDEILKEIVKLEKNTNMLKRKPNIKFVPIVIIVAFHSRKSC